MALTPHGLMTALRRLAALGALVATVLLTGPIHYKDLHLPFPDTAAHGLLFYALTLLAFTALPRMRSAEVAVGVLAVAAASELVQSLVGREMSLHDMVGDSIGIVAAYVPVAMQRLRELARTHPHTTFAEIARTDRRQGLIRSPMALLKGLTGR